VVVFGRRARASLENHAKPHILILKLNLKKQNKKKKRAWLECHAFVKLVKP